MQQLAGIRPLYEVYTNEINEIDDSIVSSSPYTILYKSCYHGGLTFLTQKGKQIQDKIIADLNINNMFEEDKIKDDINIFTQHNLYPSYKKEIDETIDLMYDNITYLNLDPDFTESCLKNLKKYNYSPKYPYNKVVCIMIVPMDYLRAHYDDSHEDVFIELLQQLKYTNFKYEYDGLVPYELGGEDFFLDIDVDKEVGDLKDLLKYYTSDFDEKNTNGNLNINNRLDANGNLDLSNSKITSLPPNLTVKGSLYLSNCKNLTSLPPGLSVGGILNLSDTKITSLPSDINVEGDLYLRNIPIKSLPSGLSVGGGLSLSGTPIASLPSDLSVKSWLDLGNCKKLTSLPSDLITVRGYLNLFGTSITSLPPGLNIKGDLDLGNTLITSLPSGLKVEDDLDLNNTPITSLPSDLNVEGRLWLRNTPLSKSHTKEQIKQMAPGVKGEIRIK